MHTLKLIYFYLTRPLPEEMCSQVDCVFISSINKFFFLAIGPFVVSISSSSQTGHNLGHTDQMLRLWHIFLEQTSGPSAPQSLTRVSRQTS